MAALAPSSPRDPFALVRDAASAEEAFRAVVSLVDAGDSDALAAMQQLLERCAAFSNPLALSKLRRPFGPTDSSSEKVRQSLIDAEAAWCNAEALGNTDFSLELHSHQVHRAELGDPHALLLLAGTSHLGVSASEVTPLALEILRNDQRPDVLRAAVRALGPDQDAPAWSALRQGLVLMPEREAEIHIAAAELIACHAGAYCGANGPVQRQTCIFGGRCDIHLALADYLRAPLSSAERALLDAVLADLLRLRGGG